MGARAPNPMLDLLLDMKRTLDGLAHAEAERRKTTNRRRGRKQAHSPGPLPGPKPTELDIARAKRALRSR